MKKILLPLIAAVILLSVSSCRTAKNYYYFKNIDSIDWNSQTGNLHDVRIMPKDMLTITVSTSDPTAATPFNLSVSNTLNASGRINSTGVALQGYLVDNDGNINFPIIGSIHVAGLTKEECQTIIRNRIMPYLSETENPIVTVRMSSFYVTVIGEIGSPKRVQVTTEKMNVIEVLADAGDLGRYALRDDILLIRTDADGRKHHVRLNINDANILNSPYYYVQQNDIIYIKPNKVAVNNSMWGQSTTIWFSAFSIMTSIASLVVNILRK